MRMLTFLALLVMAIVCTSIASYFIIFRSDIKDVKIIPMDIEVGNFVGINVENDSLHFGATSPSGSARRNITVTNTYRKPVEVTIQTEGAMDGWISGYEPIFELESGASREFMLRASPPAGTKFGKYNGTFMILFRKA